jgi:hypothetical protein
MDIRIITRHLERTQELVDLATRRAGFAFARFDALVRGLEIRLHDTNGPRGGQGIACLARVHLVNGGSVLVEDAASSPEEGISRSIARLSGRMRRMTSRRHDRG